MSVQLEIDTFGNFKPLSKNHRGTTEITRFTWTTPNKMKVQIITYGATITSVMVPDKDGNVKEVNMAFDTIEEYQNDNKYFGAILGRTANRIVNGKFTLFGKTYQVSQNVSDFHLHGGIVAFDKVNWDYYVDGTKVILSYLSVDEEEGYPGDVLTTICYEATKDNILVMDIKATSTKPTLINLTNHAYFNLAGHDAGREGLLRHEFQINADQYTELTPVLIPTGNIKSVDGTMYDFRKPRCMKAEDVDAVGYDINLCIIDGTNKQLKFISKVCCDGRSLEIWCDQPGVQFYSSNFLPSENDPPLKGKGGVLYKKHGAFCLETQNYPDSINHPNFPQNVYVPGEDYKHRCEYRFSTC